MQIDLADLRELLDYCPETGVFTWKLRTGQEWHTTAFNKRFAGTVAGTVKTDRTPSTWGYRYIHTMGKSLKAHRLAWYFYYGVWPEGEIDHINHKRDDNRITNLRLSCRGRQSKNSSKRHDNSSGVTGISWHKKTGKWMAYINVDGQRTHIGYFGNFEDARAARLEKQIATGYDESHGKADSPYPLNTNHRGDL